ncbi:MAG: hypothetical protein ACE5GW_03560, partial [Planctomycetota bacterium]
MAKLAFTTVWIPWSGRILLRHGASKMHTPSFLALLSALLVLILPTPQEIASFAPKMGAAEDAQEGARGSPRWPGQWNLARLDERYHAAIRKVELRDYEGALGLLKELKRESSREKWKKDERGRLKFLTKISTELRAVGRATMK